MGFVKKSFFSARDITCIDDVWRSLPGWMVRKNNRVHQTTYCIPRVIFETIEQQALSPLLPSVYDKSGANLTDYAIKGQPYLTYKSCKYSVPQKFAYNIVKYLISGNQIHIFDMDRNFICKHNLSEIKGSFNQLPEHRKEEGGGSLSSTLLLPSSSVLRCLDTWSSACPDLRQTNFLWAHTVFSLCSLREYSLYRYIFFDDYKPAVASRKMRYSSFQQAWIQHASQEIRFCPMCAAEQKKIYGESYWQVIPQLDGVEYCPVHQVRILSSSIHVRDFRYSFFPADTVLASPTIGTIANPIVPSPYSEIQNQPDILIAMSRCIQYLWQHLPEFSGIWFLLNRYRQLLSIPKTHDLWQSANVVREKLLQNHQVKLVNWLLSLNETVEPRYIFFSQFSLAQHAVMISLLAPSLKAFFSSNLL